jgi:hypothetical protein
VAERVIFSDLELFLTGFIRAELLAHGETDVFVSNQFPDPARPKAVIVRDDGGPSSSIVTESPTVGVTVLAGDDPTQGAEATNLAQLVKAIVKGCARVAPGNPVAAVLASNGPIKVPDESGQPRRYMTFELSVVGSSFT